MSEGDNIRIAVVIVNYNGGELIENCLDAMRAQTRVADQLIVVDNNSTDRSNDVVTANYAEVQLVQLHHNTGFAAANNRGFEQILDCEWVALLNPDTLPNHNWLESMAQAVQANPGYDVFASRLVNSVDRNLIDGEGDIYHVSGLCWRRHHGMKKSEINQTRVDPVFSVCAAAALYNVEQLKQIGGFDESFFCYYEDIDLVFRLRLRGVGCLYIEDTEVAHVGSAVTGKNSDFSVYHGHRNMVWTYIKNMPGWLFWKYLPQHVALNIISIFYYTMKGRGRIIVKSKWHAIRGIPRAIQKRKKIQSSRTVTNREIEQFMVKGFVRPYVSRFK